MFGEQPEIFHFTNRALFVILITWSTARSFLRQAHSLDDVKCARGIYKRPWLMFEIHFSFNEFTDFLHGRSVLGFGTDGAADERQKVAINGILLSNFLFF